MDSSLKKYYYSDLCEVNTPAVYSNAATEAFCKKEELYKALQKNLSKEDFSMFEDYLEKNGTINSEDNYHSFCCGIRTVVKFIADAFTSI
ncbi:MAG: hypothetical protein K2J73_00585 [Oscillospiraceae bacterium]|nr:hypothetical protein [Oscillospiraceae bacterium]